MRDEDEELECPRCGEEAEEIVKCRTCDDRVGVPCCSPGRKQRCFQCQDLDDFIDYDNS